METFAITLAQNFSEWSWAPKSWSGMAAIILVIGGSIAWFANRDARKRTADANDITNKAYKETVGILDHQLELMTKERDSYRDNLHALRNECNAQAIRVKELEMRPDVAELFRASETFYREQSSIAAEQIKVVSELARSFREHDEKVNDRMKPLYETLSKMGEGITELLRRSNAAAKKP